MWHWERTSRAKQAKAWERICRRWLLLDNLSTIIHISACLHSMEWLMGEIIIEENSALQLLRWLCVNGKKLVVVVEVSFTLKGWLWLTTPINYNHNKISFTLVLCKLLCLWLMRGWSLKSQSIINLGLGFERKLKWLLSLLALDCRVNVVGSSTFSLDLGLEAL